MTESQLPNEHSHCIKNNIERPLITRTSARGATIGAFFLTYFGAFWVFYSIANWPKAPSWLYFVFTLPVVVLTVFIVIRFINAAKFPINGNETHARHGKRIGRAFGLIFTAEVIFIYAAVFILNRIGQPSFIPIAIALIVGLHFFPLAKVFHLSIYCLTGLLIIIFSLVSLFIADEIMKLLLLGIAVAIILWISAAVVLIRHTGFNH